MPTSSTRLPAFRAAATMAARLLRNCAIGSPRRPSLAPSATIVMPGRCRVSAAAMRDAPPLEVSPLMLALATV